MFIYLLRTLIFSEITSSSGDLIVKLPAIPILILILPRILQWNSRTSGCNFRTTSDKWTFYLLPTLPHTCSYIYVCIPSSFSNIIFSLLISVERLLAVINYVKNECHSPSWWTVIAYHGGRKWKTMKPWL